MSEIRGIQEVAALLSPDFVERDGWILPKGNPECGEHNRDHFDSDSELEAGCTHVHVLDCFENGASRKGVVLEDIDDSLYDFKHPDFLAACRIGKAMVVAWASTLTADFPGRHFRIYYTELDNPIVRFHQIRENERFWMTDEEVLKEEPPNRAAVFDTRTHRLLESAE